MAQHTGGTSYDSVWDRKLWTAVKNLRAVADGCAAGACDPKDPDRVVAVVLAVLSARWSRYEWPWEREQQVRSVRDWISSVESAEVESRRLFQTAHNETISAVVALLVTIIDRAIESWSAGNPEEPPTDAVLNCIVAQLHNYHASVRPPDPKLPLQI